MISARRIREKAEEIYIDFDETLKSEIDIKKLWIIDAKVSQHGINLTANDIDYFSTGEHNRSGVDIVRVSPDNRKYYGDWAIIHWGF